MLRDNKNTKLLFVADASKVHSDGISEAEQAKKFFEIFKINNERLIIKKLANNTYQESIEIAKYLKEKWW